MFSVTKALNFQASRLPFDAPLEYDLVRDIPLTTLRNRLVLLHHFSELISPSVAMFPMEGEGSLDQLRGILVYSIKEATFRKVSTTVLLVGFPAIHQSLCAVR